MTYRELLEFAAKAAGINLEWVDYSDVPRYRGKDRPQIFWNPLEEDGDAFRLAVKLRLSIEHNISTDASGWVLVDLAGCDGIYLVSEDVPDESDRAQATRRAIVRAASSIGGKL